MSNADYKKDVMSKIDTAKSLIGELVSFKRSIESIRKSLSFINVAISKDTKVRLLVNNEVLRNSISTVAIKTGIDMDSVEWFIYKNNCGKGNLTLFKVGVHPSCKEIKTIEDFVLFYLAEESLPEVESSEDTAVDVKKKDRFRLKRTNESAFRGAVFDTFGEAKEDALDRVTHEGAEYEIYHFVGEVRIKYVAEYLSLEEIMLLRDNENKITRDK